MRFVAPILAYHAIHPERLDEINVTPTNFAAQMAWLARLGYRGVSLAEYVQQQATHPAATRRLVALTFDDGYLDNLTYGWPILERLGFTATIFVVAERVGSDIMIDPPLLTRYPTVPRAAYAYLTWSDLQQLASRGIEMGAHTCTHPKLDELDVNAQRYEIVAAKRMIEAQLQQPVKSFCYPYGHFNDKSLQLVAEAGYQQAVVTPWRAGLLRGDRFTLRRVGIYHRDHLGRFIFKTSPLFETMRTAKHRRPSAE